MAERKGDGCIEYPATLVAVKVYFPIVKILELRVLRPKVFHTLSLCLMRKIEGPGGSDGKCLECLVFIFIFLGT